MVLQVHSESELQQVIANAGNKLVIVDAFATWCGPCKALVPKLEHFQNIYQNIVIVKLDVDEVPSYSDQHNITAMPTLLFIKSGNVVDRVEGLNIVLIQTKIKTYM